MKICPRCEQTMLDAASRCVRCGYEIREEQNGDFPRRESRVAPREGIAYSGFAQLTLQIWAFLAILGAIAGIVLAFVALFEGEWLRLLAAIGGSWSQFALYVVLRRLADN